MSSSAQPEFNAEDQKPIGDIVVKAAYKLRFQIVPDPQLRAEYYAKMAELTPAQLEQTNKLIKIWGGMGHPESSEIQSFNDVLREEGATKGQLDFNDYHSDEFNPTTPTLFRVKRNVRDIDKLQELFQHKADQVARELDFQIGPKADGHFADYPEPKYWEIELFTSKLQTDGDTNDAVSDEDMNLFHFGCTCHNLKDVTKFGVVRDYNQKYGVVESEIVEALRNWNLDEWGEGC